MKRKRYETYQRTHGCIKERYKMIDLNKSVVLSGGLVNLEATLVKVAEAVAAYNETQSNNLDTVGAAVHALFDKHVGAFIQVPAVATIAVGSLNLTSLDAIAAMGDRQGLPQGQFRTGWRFRGSQGSRRGAQVRHRGEGSQEGLSNSRNVLPRTTVDYIASRRYC